MTEPTAPPPDVSALVRDLIDDRPADAKASWRKGIVAFAATVVLVTALVVAILAALDPYDTGYFGAASMWRGRIDDQKNSRARDPQFDAAIIGNSRMIMVRPELLDQYTGLHFVSLAVHGAQPIEELTVARYFLGKHHGPRAVVFGLDETWCFDPLQSELKGKFPAWLYDGSRLTYLAHLFSFRSIQEAWAERNQDGARADGFSDYEPAFHVAGADAIEYVRKKLPRERPNWLGTSKSSFPAAPRLEWDFRHAQPTTVFLLAWVPVHISFVPLPGSPGDRAMAACKAAFAATARTPSTALSSATTKLGGTVTARVLPSDAVKITASPP